MLFPLSFSWIGRRRSCYLRKRELLSAVHDNDVRNGRSANHGRFRCDHLVPLLTARDPFPVTRNPIVVLGNLIVIAYILYRISWIIWTVSDLSRSEISDFKRAINGLSFVFKLARVTRNGITLFLLSVRL